MIFKFPLTTNVLNFRTSETWQMFSVDPNFVATNDDVQRIKSICNEPLVYKWLFKDKLKNNPYPLSKAKDFINWAQQGWEDQKYFVFLIKDTQGEIQAAVDIKSNDLAESEVGYWASKDKPGIMTNAVENLCKLAIEANYKKLYADVQAQNYKSQRVLKRLNFLLEKKFIEDDKDYHRYSKKLDK